MMDQKKLKASCIPYTVKAARFGFPDVSTRYEAIPIRMYKIVHATGNSHPGGESGGLFSDRKASMPPRVKSADKPPTASGSAIHKMNFFHCIFKESPPPVSYICCTFFYMHDHSDGVLLKIHMIKALSCAEHG